MISKARVIVGYAWKLNTASVFPSCWSPLNGLCWFTYLVASLI